MNPWNYLLLPTPVLLLTIAPIIHPRLPNFPCRHVGVAVPNVVLDAGTPRERRFAELKLGLRVTSFTRYNDTLVEFHARLA